MLPYVRLLEAAGAGAAISEEQRGGSGEPGRAVAAQAAEIANRLLELRQTLSQIVEVDTSPEIHSLGLDAELADALNVKDLIDQAAAAASELELVFAIELFPVR